VFIDGSISSRPDVAEKMALAELVVDGSAVPHAFLELAEKVEDD
jgi:hypothetical protein